ncbi:MAG: GNAT family N-acetyltransferase [bacterium]
MSTKIKKAKKEDIPNILKLVEKIVDYHCEIDKYYKPYKSYDKLEEHLEKTIKDKNQKIIVAEENSEIIGYFVVGIEKAANYTVAKNIGIIDSAFIKKEYRNKGIGQKLFGQALEYLKSRKIKHIELDVDARNDLGINFWKENKFFGFRIKMRRDL